MGGEGWDPVFALEFSELDPFIHLTQISHFRANVPVTDQQEKDVHVLRTPNAIYMSSLMPPIKNMTQPLIPTSSKLSTISSDIQGTSATLQQSHYPMGFPSPVESSDNAACACNHPHDCRCSP